MDGWALEDHLQESETLKKITETLVPPAFMQRALQGHF